VPIAIIPRCFPNVDFMLKSGVPHYASFVGKAILLYAKVHFMHLFRHGIAFASAALPVWFDEKVRFCS